jgi:hypothetical protein
MKIAGTKMTHPTKSRLRRRATMVACRNLGPLKNSNITVKVTAIEGRLILLLLGLLKLGADWEVIESLVLEAVANSWNRII